MHQENYDEEDEYEDDQDSHQDYYKHYFKFDVNAWESWGKFLYDSLEDITNYTQNKWYAYGFDPKKFPVNSYSPDTGLNKQVFQYLGVNYNKEPIFKPKHFIIDHLSIAYIKHLQANAAHFLKQPSYYNGLYNILN